MEKFKKGDRVNIQTQDPESALNGAWGIVQRYGDGCVTVAIEGLVTEANTLPFDVSELTKVESTPAYDAIDRLVKGEERCGVAGCSHVRRL